MSEEYTNDPTGDFVEIYTLVEDDDAADAASVRPMLAALADNAARLKSKHVTATSYTSDGGDADGALETFTDTGSYTDADNAEVTAAGAAVGDFVLLIATFTAELVTDSSAASVGRLRIAATQQYGGVSPSTATLDGAYAYFKNAATGGTGEDRRCVTMHALVPVTKSGDVRFVLRGKVSNASEPLVVYYASMTAVLIRSSLSV